MGHCFLRIAETTHLGIFSSISERPTGNKPSRRIPELLFVIENEIPFDDIARDGKYLHKMMNTSVEIKENWSLLSIINGAGAATITCRCVDYSVARSESRRT